MIAFRFYPRLFCWLALAFVLFVIIGTLSYEMAHLAVAEIIGLKTHVRYAGHAIYCATAKGISPLAMSLYQNAGIIAIPIIGTIGIVLLFNRKKSARSATRLTPGRWFLVLISLFWLRPALMFVACVPFMLKGKIFSMPETFLARKLNLPPYSIVVATGIAGIIMFLLVLFRFIPEVQRLTLLAAGLLGSVLGIWL